MINPEIIKAYRHGERIPDPFRGFLAVFYMPGRRGFPGNTELYHNGGNDPGGGFLLPIVTDENRNQGNGDGRKRNRGRLDRHGLKTAGGIFPGVFHNASSTAAAFLRRLSLYMLAYTDGGGVLYASIPAAKMKRFTRVFSSPEVAGTLENRGLKGVLTGEVNDQAGQSLESGEFWKKEAHTTAHKHPRARAYIRGQRPHNPIYIRAYIGTRPGIPYARIYRSRLAENLLYAREHISTLTLLYAPDMLYI